MELDLFLQFVSREAVTADSLLTEAKRWGLTITSGTRGKNKKTMRRGFGMRRSLTKQLELPKTLFYFGRRKDGLFYAGEKNR